MLLRLWSIGDNSFLVPSGKAGKDCVLEMARLYQAYADKTTITFCCTCHVLYVSGTVITEASC